MAGFNGLYRTGLFTLVISAGCGVDTIPTSAESASDGTGPRIRFESRGPAFDVPFPTDLYTWPDPTSRTGVRLNLSSQGLGTLETQLYAALDRQEGWGALSPISVGFDRSDPADTRAAVDLRKLVERQQRDDYDFSDDAIYVVNLETGVPIPLELGEGSFDTTRVGASAAFAGAPRNGEVTLLWETADETADPLTGRFDPARTSDGTRAGSPIYRPEWDSDFDGVLDRPNLIDPGACENQEAVALAPAEARADLALVRGRCIADHLVNWYERQTETLIARPLLPMREFTRYAVVITDRLIDPDGQPVRSPFAGICHPLDSARIHTLGTFLSNPELAGYYGDIGGTGLDHVRFAWTFTTGATISDLRTVHDGLNAQGPLASLAEQFAPGAAPERAIGVVSRSDLAQGKAEPSGWRDDAACRAAGPSLWAVNMAAAAPTLAKLIGRRVALDRAHQQELVASWENISHLVVGWISAPDLLAGAETFDMDFASGRGTVESTDVPFLLAVPRPSVHGAQPFPLAYVGHDFGGSMVDSLISAGRLAEQGVATVGMNAVSHGTVLDDDARAELSAACALPFAGALALDRSADVDADGAPDPGADYFDGRLAHARDAVRQSAVELLQLLRVFASFDGRAATSDELPEPGAVAGDFDGDGTPDAGGRAHLHASGTGFGADLAVLVAALDPRVHTAVPVSATGSFLDAALRSSAPLFEEGLGGALTGPAAVGIPAQELLSAVLPTRCTVGSVSLRMVTSIAGRSWAIEIACLDLGASGQGGTVIVTNGESQKRRCARVDAQGHFWVPFAASAGDRFWVSVWDEPDAVDSYDPSSGCNVTSSSAREIVLTERWGLDVELGGATHFAGDPLRALVSGLGLARQTPALRRLWQLAESAVDAANPAHYSPALALTAEGGRAPAALLAVETAGDSRAPVGLGVAVARAAGALPFLKPGARDSFPAYADYVTPEALYDALGTTTPNRLLIQTRVLESLASLETHSTTATATCGANELPAGGDDALCHAPCASNADCLIGQSCMLARCVMLPPDAAECSRTLFDPDAIDEGTAGLGQLTAAVPLRLGRKSAPLASASLDSLWAPRLAGEPGQPDADAWDASSPLLAQLVAYTDPHGAHGIATGSSCQVFALDRYYGRLIARFIASDGADLYYLTHPSSHHCLADADLTGCGLTP
jgi:hypothetical protein